MSERRHISTIKKFATEPAKAKAKAKANGLIPFDYLTKIFNELPKLNDEAELDHLLPWNLKLK